MPIAKTHFFNFMTIMRFINYKSIKLAEISLYSLIILLDLCAMYYFNWYDDIDMIFYSEPCKIFILTLWYWLSWRINKIGDRIKHPGQWGLSTYQSTCTASTILAIYERQMISNTAFTKSLASEQSRDITFAALVPLFQIQTLTLTQTPSLTNTPNHALTQARSQTLTWPRNETFFPV